MAHGKTRAEAVSNAEEAIAFWLQTAKADGIKVPTARDVFLSPDPPLVRSLVSSCFPFFHCADCSELLRIHYGSVPTPFPTCLLLLADLDLSFGELHHARKALPKKCGSLRSPKTKPMTKHELTTVPLKRLENCARC
jgi:hypothetical protein